MTKGELAITPRVKVASRITISRILLSVGCVLCGVSCLTAILALTLPYWVYISATMETTVAGLTDATEVTYFYGLMRYCLKMTATHLNQDICEAKSLDSLQSWERIAFLTLTAAILLMVFTIVQLFLHLACWNKLVFIVLANLSSAAAAISISVGVSLYQINATVQVLDIGGLTTADFEPEFLSTGFWFGFTSGVVAFAASLLLVLGTFSWKKPKEPRKIYGARYRTTVKPQRCPYKGRQPAVITVSQI